ncbi:hypothetical protein XI25_12620 [Paenibacillus sp. DMB20]|nr:hypothetical protein XI25_12620 [Paenibacillus sp. DMB20]
MMKINPCLSGRSRIQWIRIMKSGLLLIYFFIHRFILTITDCRRAPLYDLIFYDKFLLLIPRQVLMDGPNRLVISNHVIQCYAILCLESERILIRFQTYKEPSLKPPFTWNSFNPVSFD